MENSKVTLSDAELQMVSDAGFILTKNGIIEKVYQLFGELSAEYTLLFAGLREGYPEVFATGAKISKGEKYEDLPWVMLDYPRCFSEKRGHFAIRTFFWWGHFFSIRLQLSGEYRQMLMADILNKLPENNDWKIGFTADPWDHSLPENNWDINNPNPESIIEKGQTYLIISAKIPLAQWVNARDFLLDHCNQLVRSLEKN